MKNTILKLTLAFVILCCTVQISFVLLDTFWPEKVQTLTNLIRAVYNRIG